tara:strand:- start:1202 stop:1429 length:228 start_codon:yes stop_codon:yes gene_type:complete
MSKTLYEVEKNQEIIISHYKNEEISTALSSIGFIPGTEVKVLNKLPFNGPLTCECRNTKFAIRAEDAAQVIVLPE